MTEDVTRRTVSKMALAGLVAAETTSLHAQTVAPKIVQAVAMGPTLTPNVRIDATHPVPPGTRKYIDGFITGMAPRVLGTDYVIDYRECTVNDFGTVFPPGLAAEYILCLSTRVVLAAAQAYPPPSPKQIIGIVSQPKGLLPGNVRSRAFGASAGRINDARFAYRSLLNSVTPALTDADVTVLHDNTYAPSVDALNDIQEPYDPTRVIAVHNPTEVVNAINNTIPPNSGVLLLPVDWMFGSATQIIQAAINRPVLDFWLITDRVVPTPPSAF